MVKSGLINRVDVSHYRLSLHLTLAFIIFIYLFWIYLKFTKMIKINGQEKIPYKMPQIFLFLLLLQVSIGAFVSGLDAGQIYQTWPLMNTSYFPDDSNISDLFKTSVFSIPSLVQFLHRNIAYLIFIFFLSIFFIVFKDNNLFYLRGILIIILLIFFLQIFLGILTVLSGAELLIASMHQLGSVILITATIILIFKNSKS